MSVVSINNKQNDRNGAKKTSNVWQYFVEFLEVALILSTNSGFEERKTTVGVSIDLVRIFQCKICYDSSIILMVDRKRKNTLVSSNTVFFHKKNTFSSQVFGKNYVIVVLQVMCQVLFTRWVDQRVDEVNCKEKWLLLLKIRLDFTRICTWPWRVWLVCTFLYCHFQCLRKFWGILSLNVVLHVSRQTQPVIHLESFVVFLNIWKSLPVVQSAWFKRVL